MASTVILYDPGDFGVQEKLMREFDRLKALTSKKMSFGAAGGHGGGFFKVEDVPECPEILKLQQAIIIQGLKITRTYQEPD